MSSSSSSADDANTIWQDREIRFDVPFALLKPRRGEVEIDSINAVEDTKGNNGEKGQLSVTNLRIIWCSHKDPRTNLSQSTNSETEHDGRWRPKEGSRSRAVIAVVDSTEPASRWAN